jgi:hypothetical protein
LGILVFWVLVVVWSRGRADSFEKIQMFSFVPAYYAFIQKNVWCKKTRGNHLLFDFCGPKIFFQFSNKSLKFETEARRGGGWRRSE